MTHKIWLLLDSRTVGGIETHVLQLAQAIQHSLPYAVSVMFLRRFEREHPLVTQLRAQAIETEYLRTGLYSAMRRRHPALIHTHGYRAGILGRISAKQQNIPVVSTFHAGEITTGKLAWYDRIDRWTAQLADHRLAVSQEIAQRIPGQCRILNNFIRVPPTISQGDQIAFVGRLSAEKGPDSIIKLAKRLPNQRFHLYGDGPMASSLQQHCPANCQLHGPQLDMGALWGKIGILLIPSRFEGLPMAALEAMSRGIPVLAYDVGALSQLIQTHVNGWRVPPGDLCQFTTHLRQWLNASACEKAQMSALARQTIIDRFSVSALVPSLQNIYRSAMMAH